jgi:ferredoxin
VSPVELHFDPIACDGHGLCAELLPELVVLDDWGYPMFGATEVPPELERHARRAVAACPKLALSLRRPAAARVPVRVGGRR